MDNTYDAKSVTKSVTRAMPSPQWQVGINNDKFALKISSVHWQVNNGKYASVPGSGIIISPIDSP